MTKLDISKLTSWQQSEQQLSNEEGVSLEITYLELSFAHPTIQYYSTCARPRWVDLWKDADYLAILHATVTIKWRSKSM